MLWTSQGHWRPASSPWAEETTSTTLTTADKVSYDLDLSGDPKFAGLADGLQREKAHVTREAGDGRRGGAAANGWW